MQEYVLVIVNIAVGAVMEPLPSAWCLAAYRSLSHQFRKNVAYIIMLQPSTFVRAMLTVAGPFLSSKVHRKICKVSLQGRPNLLFHLCIVPYRLKTSTSIGAVKRGLLTNLKYFDDAASVPCDACCFELIR